jgi:hypothetical protein
VEFILQLAVDEWEPHPEIRALGSGIFWEDGDQGAVSFTSENCDVFDDFVSYATNGIEDYFVIWNLSHNGGGGGSYNISETIILDGNPDLLGKELTVVHLRINSLDIWPWAPFPGQEGYRYSVDITWEFYGAIVPEPSTAFLCMAGIIMQLIKARRPSE